MRLIGNVQGPLRRLGLDERITAFHHTFDQEGISPFLSIGYLAFYRSFRRQDLNPELRQVLSYLRPTSHLGEDVFNLSLDELLRNVVSQDQGEVRLGSPDQLKQVAGLQPPENGLDIVVFVYELLCVGLGYFLMHLPELLFIWMRFDELQKKHPVINVQDDVLAVREHLRINADPITVEGFEEGFVSAVKPQRRSHQLALRHREILLHLPEYASRFLIERDGDHEFFRSFRLIALFFAHGRVL